MPEAYDIAQLGLSQDSEIQALLGQCADIEPRRYRDGEFLMQEGEESSDLFIVLEGACVVERPGAAPGSPASMLAALTASPDRPVILGEMAYFGTQRRSASVRVVGCTHALCLHPHHIEVIVEAFPGLLRLIFRQFTQRLMEANQAQREWQARFAMPSERRMGAPGEVLFSEGEPAEKLFQLVAGEIRMDRRTEGGIASETVSAEGLPQGFLDLEAFLSQGFHDATATIEQMAFLITVDKAHREAVVRNHPGLVLDCLRGRSPA